MLDLVPVEIFRKIIKLALDPYESEVDSGLDNIINIGLRPPIKMSHVCRSWRTTLLSDPTLWTCLNIPRMKPDHLEEFLRRSGSAPLSVFISFNHATTSDIMTPWYGILPTTLPLVLQEVPRIRMLDFTIVDTLHRSMAHILNQVLQYLRQPAPMLQTLYVTAECWTEHERALQTLFSGNAPQLKNVYYQVIHDFQELSSSPLLQNLSRLHLHLWPSVKIHPDILLNVLQLSPCLRVFGLISVVGPAITLDMLRSDHRVHLPQLRLLTLKGDSMTRVASFLLEHVIFPFESLRYSIDSCQDFQFRKSDLEWAPLKWFLARQHYTSLSLSVFADADYFHIRLKFTETYPYETEYSTFMTTYDSAYEAAESLPIFLQSFRLSDITELHLTGAPLSTAILRNTLLVLPNLNHLIIEHSRFSTSLSHLLALTPPQQPSSHTQVGDQEQETENESSDEDNPRTLDNTSSPIFPCPSLLTLTIKFIPGKRSKLDKLYAQAIAKCYSARLLAGHSFTCISIYRSPESSVEEAENMLLSNKDCPIEILMFRSQKS